MPAEPLRLLPGALPLPALGLGTWRMGESRGAHAAEVTALRLALELGYRAFDTAEMYADGGAESVLGEALAAALRGGQRRDGLCIVSKVLPQHAGRDDVVAACERSLRRLRLDHLDLYLLHWRGAVPLAHTVEGFERLRSRGLIRHWGVSNFDLHDLHELRAVAQGGGCAANQVWYSLTQRGAEFDLLPWQQAQAMPLMAYSPIDQGALATAPGLRALAAARGATPAQLALAWVLSRPGVMAIPKSGDAAHLRDNLAAAQMGLDEGELRELDRLFPPPRRKRPLAVN